MNNFDHYIAVDWAQSNMAIARITKKGRKLSTFDVDSDVVELRTYLKSLKGSKILTIEESSTAQWLYTELNDSVDKLIVCDPRRNRLLSEGPKTDKIDACKLVKLLRAGLLKEIYHSGEHFIYLRKIVSGYEDVINSGVRVKNQKSSIFRAQGKNAKTDDCDETDEFVLSGLNRAIDRYEEEKQRYQKEFGRLCKQHIILKNLKGLPGIDEIGAVKIASRVVNAKRFPTKGRFYLLLSYGFGPSSHFNSHEYCSSLFLLSFYFF